MGGGRAQRQLAFALGLLLIVPSVVWSATADEPPTTIVAPTPLRAPLVDEGDPAHLLRFNDYSFDPAAGAPWQPDPWGGTTELYLVQFQGPVHHDDLVPLESLGAKIGWYQPQDAFLVRIDDRVVAAMEALPHVRAVIPYDAGLRLEPHLSLDEPVLDLLVVPFDDAYALAREVRALEGTVLRFDPADLRISLSRDRLVALAHSPEAAYILPWVDPQVVNDQVARQLRVRQDLDGPLRDDGTALWSYDPTLPGFDGIAGQGMTVAVGDTGVWGGHALIPAAKQKWYGAYGAAGGDWDDCDGHGTHVAGTSAGEGPVYAGMAPKAQLIGQVMLVCGWGVGGQEQLRDARAHGANASTNSWGWPAFFGEYTVLSREYDLAVRDVDDALPGRQEQLTFFAAGNSGAGATTIIHPATAKDVVSIGALSSNSLGVAGFSSRGPTSDGRIKPDVMSTGMSVTSASISCATCYTSWAGTSMATPGAAGATTVMLQYYSARDGVTPSPALTKALLVNGASPISGQPYPSFDTGWGRIDIVASTQQSPTHRIWYVDQDSLLALDAGQVAAWEVPVRSGAELRVDLVWGDEAGAGNNPIPSLVNDLDLRLIAPDGTSYRGNQFAAGESLPNPATSDSVNNVEGSRLLAPQVGTWRVEVRGQDVPVGPQDFSLVVSGDVGTIVPVQLPHVELQLEGFAADDGLLVEGDTVTFRAQVRNLGSVPATDVSVRLGGPLDDALVASTTIPLLGAAGTPGETHPLLLQWDATRGLDQSFSLVVDPQDLYLEYLEDNNGAATSVDVHHYGAGLRLAGSDHLDLLPGASGSFTVVADNLADLPQQVELQLDGQTAPWETSLNLSDPLRLPLTEGGSGTATLQLVAPLDALAGETFAGAVTMLAQGDDLVRQVQMGATVLQQGGVEATLLPAAGPIAPGTSLVLQAHVLNRGNGVDTIEVHPWIDAGWDVVADPWRVEVGAREQATIPLTVLAPRGLVAGSKASVHLEATSTFDPTLPPSTTEVEVEIAPTRGVAVSISGVSILLQGQETGSLQVTLHNSGNTEADAQVWATFPAGLIGGLDRPAVHLAAFGTATAELSVSALPHTLAGDLPVEVHAHGGGSDWSATVAVNVPQHHGLLLSLSEDAISLDAAGDQAVVEVHVTNTGNGFDRYDVSVGGMVRGIEAHLRLRPLILGPGEAVALPLTISTTGAAAGSIPLFVSVSPTDETSMAQQRLLWVATTVKPVPVLVANEIPSPPEEPTTEVTFPQRTQAQSSSLLPWAMLLLGAMLLVGVVTVVRRSARSTRAERRAWTDPPSDSTPPVPEEVTPEEGEVTRLDLLLGIDDDGSDALEGEAQFDVEESRAPPPH